MIQRFKLSYVLGALLAAILLFHAWLDHTYLDHLYESPQRTDSVEENGAQMHGYCAVLNLAAIIAGVALVVELVREKRKKTA